MTQETNHKDVKALSVNKVAILGAGVMGAQIAAHFVNAQIPVILFDLPQEGKDVNALANNAIKHLKKLKPAPLALPGNHVYIEAANYDSDLAKLAECDLVIEAIAERMDWKLDLFKKVQNHLTDSAVLASNTSGLSINEIADALPAGLRQRFCGIHFFNPPRYMHLLELIPNQYSCAGMLQQLESFMVARLGKGVVYGKDTPNFIANRIGVFSILATMHHTEQFSLGFDEVDALTGTLIGRAKSATYRTMDVVGLDTMAHVIRTMAEGLSDDPWHAFFTIPAWLEKLIEVGAIGQKAGAGVFKKVKRDILCLDPNTGEYRASDGVVDAGILSLLKKKDPRMILKGLRESSHPQAQFLWSCYRDLFHYCACTAENIADSVRDLDLAVRWGFGWKQGPFETWQAAGWQDIAVWLEEDRAAGKTLVDIPLPTWVSKAAYTEQGALSFNEGQYIQRSDLPVYQRQIFPEPVFGEQLDEGQTILETDSIRLWESGDNIAVISFKTKMNTISSGVLDGLQESIAIAEKDYKGLVIWQCQGEHFSAGADLLGFSQQLAEKGEQAILDTLVQFQDTSMALRYSSIPTVAAVKGYVFGGGCELAMHCNHVVASLESYVGLVEAGVGLLPAGGGCKEFVRRMIQGRVVGENPYPILQSIFKTIAMAEVSTSSEEAKQKGFLRASDSTAMNVHELLYLAKQQVQAMAANFAAPLPSRIPVIGSDGIATLKMGIVNMLKGGFISEHDAFIAENIATVLCGGDLAEDTVVDEAWYLRLEREGFIRLMTHKKTQERIAHTLKTGKPLRN